MSRKARDRRFRGLTRQELALLAITVVWGATFLVVSIAMRSGAPMYFVGLRFLVAGLLSAVVFARALRGLRWREVGAGGAIGIAIFLGYGLQSYGQETVTASNAAFITALYVPFVPLLQWIAFRKAPRWATVAGIVLAFLGLLLLTGGPKAFDLSGGDLTILIATVAIAAEVVLISLVAPAVDARRVTVVQLLIAGALGSIAGPLLREPLPLSSWTWVGAAVALGAASCVIQLTMNWAQRSVSPSRATILYAGEPVWGGVFGRLAGDRLPPVAIVGALLIVAGVLVSELRPARPGRAEPIRAGADPTG